MSEERFVPNILIRKALSHRYLFLAGNEPNPLFYEINFVLDESGSIDRYYSSLRYEEGHAKSRFNEILVVNNFFEGQPVEHILPRLSVKKSMAYNYIEKCVLALARDYNNISAGKFDTLDAFCEDSHRRCFSCGSINFRIRGNACAACNGILDGRETSIKG